ncbi:unnamed protein product [Cuscuta campestris]|uniref:Uncharacterized protein n=1 Tax=Cuscuta campestris TaxID=132261 RepID=A0A484MJ44_9ASTE|nr:unnamed protein product [Cuscuta campestris]
MCKDTPGEIDCLRKISNITGVWSLLIDEFAEHIYRCTAEYLPNLKVILATQLFDMSTILDPGYVISLIRKFLQIDNKDIWTPRVRCCLLWKYQEGVGSKKRGLERVRLYFMGSCTK